MPWGGLRQSSGRPAKLRGRGLGSRWQPEPLLRRHVRELGLAERACIESRIEALNTAPTPASVSV